MPPWGHCKAVSGGLQPLLESGLLVTSTVRVWAGAATVREHFLGHAGTLGWHVALQGPNQLYPTCSPSVGDADYFL